MVFEATYNLLRGLQSSFTFLSQRNEKYVYLNIKQESIVNIILQNTIGSYLAVNLLLQYQFLSDNTNERIVKNIEIFLTSHMLE